MDLPGNVVEAAAAMASQMQVRTSRTEWEGGTTVDNHGESTNDFDWQEAKRHFLSLLAEETSLYRLGQVLGHDAGLDLPVPVIKATYERMIDLGATDAITRYRYASYLKMHGPEWDYLADQIISETEEAVRAAGLLDGAWGHHPVFYSGPT